ncbi:MAG: prepilin-type N-terminal cleavage/methylation domain-containing protein [Nitrospira sp.]|nr:MAG: prepilin-type N-terminal cleavage/methylation domain-containing protein [Nitrospira sp.]
MQLKPSPSIFRLAAPSFLTNYSMTHLPNYSSRERGFTLTEVLIAVAILATIATMVSTSFSSTFRLMEAIESEGDLDHMARSSLIVIANELISGQPPASMWLGRNGNEDGMPSDILAFVTASHVRSSPNAPESDLTRVTYARQSSRLMRYAVRNLYTTSLDAVDQAEIAVGVVGFNVRYYSGTTQLWSDEWDQTLKKLPHAVLIELTLTNPKNEAKTFIEWIPIPLQS